MNRALNTPAGGKFLCAEGPHNNAEGKNTRVEGLHTNAEGVCICAEGPHNPAGGRFLCAEGPHNRAGEMFFVRLDCTNICRGLIALEFGIWNLGLMS